MKTSLKFSTLIITIIWLFYLIYVEYSSHLQSAIEFEFQALSLPRFIIGKFISYNPIGLTLALIFSTSALITLLKSKTINIFFILSLGTLILTGITEQMQGISIRLPYSEFYSIVTTSFLAIIFAILEFKSFKS